MNVIIIFIIIILLLTSITALFSLLSLPSRLRITRDFLSIPFVCYLIG